jgi:hypothetical protein
MRLGYTYVPSTSERERSATNCPDHTSAQFAETMGYEVDGRQLMTRDAFHARFEREAWINELHAVLVGWLSPNRRTLGLGSGFGEHELRFALLGYDITASDVLLGPLQLTNGLFPEFRYCRFDVFETESNEAWDDILVTGMDSYFDQTRASVLFRRIARLLREGEGSSKRLIFVLRYKNNAATWLIDQCLVARATLLNGLRVLFPRRPRWIPQAHGFRRSQRDIVDLATAAGFELRRIAHAGFGVELSRLAFLTRLDRLSKGLLTRLDRRLHWFNNCTIFEFRLIGSDGFSRS